MWASTKARKPYTCSACSAKYRPHRTPDTMRLCGSCIIPTLKYPYNVDCSVCKKNQPGPDRRVPLCFVCVRDPEQRPTVLRRLLKGQAARKEQNGKK